MKKIIITFLFLFLVFGIKEEVLAGFEDGKPTLIKPPDGAKNVSSLNTYFEWRNYKGGGIDAQSFKISIRGPGTRIEKCVSYKRGKACGKGSLTYSTYPCHTLSDSEWLPKGITPKKTPCKYYWKVQAWEKPHCEGKHSKWSDKWSFTTVTSTTKCPSTPGAPGVIYEKPIECCKLKYDFTDVDENCEKDSVVASPDYRTCQRTVDATTSRWSVCCFLNTLYKISDWLTWLVLPFAILVSLAGAWTLTTSGGDPQKVNKGRDYIIWALVGAVVCFFIKAILAIIKMIV